MDYREIRGDLGSVLASLGVVKVCKDERRSELTFVN